MKSYEVKIQGTIFRDYTVSASSASEAEALARSVYAEDFESLTVVKAGQVILDDEGYLEWGAVSVEEVTA